MGENLLTVLNQGNKVKQLLTNHQNYQTGKIIGLEASGKHLLLGTFFKQVSESLLIVTSNSVKADEMYEDLVRLLTPEQVLLFPKLEILPHEALEIEATIKRERLEVLEKIFNPQAQVIITSVQALLALVIPPDVYRHQLMAIRLGQELDTAQFTSRLVTMGYERVGQVQNKGEFSVRGGIIDFYPYTVSQPVRIELFGEQIDSLRYFEVSSQRSVSQLKKVLVGPATEFILPTDLEEGQDKIKKDLEQTAAELAPEEATELREKVNHDLERIEEGITFPGLRQYISYFYQPATLLDYFQGTIVVDNWKSTKQRAIKFLTDFQKQFNNLLNKGKVLSDYQNYYQDFNQVLYDNQFKKLYLSPTNRQLEETTSQFVVEFSERELESYQGQLPMFVEQLTEYFKQDYRIVIGLSNLSKAERLQKRLREDDLPAVVVEDITEQIKPANIVVTATNLKKGFSFPREKFIFYTETELFKQVNRQRRRSKNFDQGTKISSFTDLEEGDYVVHEHHGIGRYLGIKTVEVQDKSKDYLLLEYAGNDKLYVPTNQVDLIQKYVGMKEEAPNLHKLDSDKWAKAKARVKESVEEMAEELLELYAKREMKEGYAFSEDTDWQQQFEAAFPYQETEDQLQAIEEVKADMESPQPMDRLLCGDVGYGKTEVAIRAMFKAVMEGKQAAFLVPTTILAQQHWNNLLDRFSDFPVNIEMVSRFRSPQEQKEIIAGLEAGSIDIVVGTHRLLSKDIKFKDLGLVVVDEEQRFGVAQKESLKQFKENVDVLTLTATPIPRTLHMSLVGIRDISLIETPPKNRYPIRTYVGEYNDDLVEEAIVRELNRNGQVYFVHNRVKDIKEVAAKIKNILPEADIAVAHGQMRETKLEKLMLDFWDGNYDILVCTTIIENGMDISSVNTIIINQADKLGLAQLYQLRGRVGRSNRIAYAYLLYDEGKFLSEVAEKRLKAIKEFTSLGSGFKIAMRDLELRGAGNILGPEQHGHIETVGFSLYCKLLDKAINRLQNEGEEEQKLKLDLDIDAYLPGDYISDSKQKIEIYRRIKSVTSQAEYDQLQTELQDRFGSLPFPVKKLLQIAKLRVKAQEAPVVEIKEQKTKIALQLEADASLAGKDVLALGQHFSQVKFVADQPPRLEVTAGELTDEKKIDLLLKIIDFLIE